MVTPARQQRPLTNSMQLPPPRGRQGPHCLCGGVYSVWSGSGILRSTKLVYVHISPYLVSSPSQKSASLCGVSSPLQASAAINTCRLLSAGLGTLAPNHTSQLPATHFSFLMCGMNSLFRT